MNPLDRRVRSEGHVVADYTKDHDCEHALFAALRPSIESFVAHK